MTGARKSASAVEGFWQSAAMAARAVLLAVVAVGIAMYLGIGHHSQYVFDPKEMQVWRAPVRSHLRFFRLTSPMRASLHTIWLYLPFRCVLH